MHHRFRATVHHIDLAQPGADADADEPAHPDAPPLEKPPFYP
jgi:hypothetical protein